MKENVLQRTLSPIGAGLAQFEKAFTDALDEQGGLIGEMAAHVLSSPGKRIRPAMYLLSSFVHDDAHPTSVGGNMLKGGAKLHSEFAVGQSLTTETPLWVIFAITGVSSR